MAILSDKYGNTKTDDKYGMHIRCMKFYVYGAFLADTAATWSQAHIAMVSMHMMRH